MPSLLPYIPAPRHPGPSLGPPNSLADGCRRSGEPERALRRCGAAGLGAAPSPLPLSQLSTHVGNGESPLPLVHRKEGGGSVLGKGKGREKAGRDVGLLDLGFMAVPGLAPREPRRPNTGFAMTRLPPGASPGRGVENRSSRPRCPAGAAASPAVAPSWGEGAAVLPCWGREQRRHELLPPLSHLMGLLQRWVSTGFCAPLPPMNRVLAVLCCRLPTGTVQGCAVGGTRREPKPGAVAVQRCSGKLCLSLIKVLY